MTVRVLHGDCREVLKTLPAESVHCVVTSPPYFGLRDYGTATWEGGDPGCDHSPERRGSRFATPVSSKQASNPGSGTASRRDCFCGARRIDSQIGLEPTPDAYVAEMVAVFRELRRVLRKDGVTWLNLGDSYAGGGTIGRNDASTMYGASSAPLITSSGTRSRVIGLKPKDLIGVPWRVAFALQVDGWYLRQDIIWAKPNPMPESVRDRCTKSHEYVFLLTKSPRYFWDADAIAEPLAPGTLRSNGIDPETGRGYPSNHKITARDRNAGAGDGWGNQAPGATRSMNPSGRNRRSVWTIATQPFAEAHFATMPHDLAELCIKAGTSERGCCPECGAPWVRVVDRLLVNTEGWGMATKDHHGNVQGSDAIARNGQGRAGDSIIKTVGWQPSCSCPGGLHSIPCTVLDPFGGAGTTGLVADRLQRNAILIELNPEYAAMAERRIRNDAPLFAETVE